eukprot:CAMPEP_0183484568 /NCGR_PEP_ID=MMETSP0370-20130417/178989_1 /TAXON_ID=268820 /ORGANISM="Peridinium aciculiferum, Strain PAER-2" /LENGTH=471 /DNA_ID=CAMNT_0025677859 /DNA_START=127 /DNA_END=1539 /DNA_ORIENTATION=+
MSSSAANKLSGAEAAAAQPQQQQTQPPKRSWADIARCAAAPPTPTPAPKPAAAAPCAPAAAAPLAQPAEAEATEDAAPAEVTVTAAAAAQARRPWVGLAQRMATALGSSSGGDSSSDDSDFDEADESEPESQPEDEPSDEPEPNEVQPEEELLDDDSVPKFMKAPAKLKPGKRGVRKCLCQGEVLVMLGHYGWLASLCEIDHPDAQKNGGRIYFQRGDVAGGLQIVQGDDVEFFLYEDSRGLGAEDVRLRSVPVRPAHGAEEALQRPKAEVCAAAAELSPLAVPQVRSVPIRPAHEAEEALQRPKAELCAAAAEFRPSGRASGGSSPDAAAQATLGMSASAVEFTPGFSAKAAEFVPGMSSGAAAFVPSKPAVASAGTKSFALVFVPLKAAPAPTQKAQGLNVFAFNDAYLSDSDDEDSTIAGGSGSSSHGASSDSEPETPTASKKWVGAFPSPPLAPPPGLPIPHGLVLP